jgi:hypothetical protein
MSYMPSNSDAFDILQNNVYNSVVLNSDRWGISQEAIIELDPPRDRWILAISTFNNLATRTPAATQEKNDAQKGYTSDLRMFIQGHLMHNKSVTDADRRDMGLPVYDKTKTHAPVPDTRPTLSVDFSQVGRHKIRVRNEDSNSSARPKGAVGFELWSFVGDSEPQFDKMKLTGVIMRSSHVLDYASSDRGKRVWYVARWVNSRGDKGPRSEIIFAIIP